MTNRPTQEQQQDRAVACIAAMSFPKQWRARVWENSGWHWCIESSDGWWAVYPFNIYPHSYTAKPHGYTAFLAADNTSLHRPRGGRWTGQAPTVLKAMQVAWDKAEADRKEIDRAVQGSNIAIAMETASA